MKLIIAGSRSIDLHTAFAAIDDIAPRIAQDIEVTEIVSGTARGVDQAGESYAKYSGIPIKRFPADWDQYGRGAGHIRNAAMADYADALLLIWDGSSKGSANMKQNMIKMNKTVYEVIKLTGR